MRKTNINTNEKGIVLIIVIIVIAILSTLVVDFIYSTHVDYEITINSVRDVRSKYIAKSGVNVVKAALVNNDLEELASQVSNFTSISANDSQGNWSLSVSSFPVGEGFVSITVNDERSKININALVNQSTNQVDFQVLTQVTELLRYLEIDSGDADLFISSLINWLDHDVQNSQNDQDPRGASANYYSTLQTPYRIKDGPLDSLDEIKLIQGMNQDFFDIVKPYLTIYPRNKQINFSTATIPVMIATLKAAKVSAIEQQGQNDPDDLDDDLAEELADELLSKRLTQNIISRADVRRTVRDVDPTLGITAGLSGVVLNTGKSNTFSVSATGFTGDVDSTSRTVEAVLLKAREGRSNIARVVSWKER